MKQYIVRDSASGKHYRLTVSAAEHKRYGDDAPYRQYARDILKIDVGPDFDTGNVDIDVEPLPASPRVGTVELFPVETT